MADLPRGASDRRDLASRIAADGSRLTAAADYWMARYAEIGEPVLDTGDFGSPGMLFATELTDERLDVLAPETRGLVGAGEEGQMIKRAGCLMSLAEIGEHVEGGPVSAEEVARKLGALPTGGVQAEDISLPRIVEEREIALAIRYVREIFDVSRRFAICAEVAGAHELDVAEVLALYRREGAFVIAPPASSYRFAPLIDAKPSGCRLSGSPLWDSTVKRAGFVLSHVQASPSTPSKDDPISRSFGLAIRNIVAIGGVDSVIMPRLPAADELLAVFGAALAHSPRPAPLEELRRDVLARLSRSPSTRGTLHARQNSIASQADIFDGLSVGLLMLRLEELGPTDSLPAPDALFSTLRSDVTGLLEAHPPSAREAGRVFIEANDEAGDVRISLRLGGSWYASRRRADTLVARRDRARVGELPRLSPFLGYLRYHVGDVTFMGVIVRFLASFEEIVRQSRRRAKPWPRSDEFLRLVEHVVWSRAETRTAARWLSFWRTVGGEAAWRHHGLVEALRAGGALAPWLAAAERARDRVPARSQARMRRTADTALAAVEMMQAKGLWEAFDLMLRTAPVKTVTEKFPLIGLDDLPSQRRAMAKAHNFEQLRIAYQQAVEAVGAAGAAGSAPAAAEPASEAAVP